MFQATSLAQSKFPRLRLVEETEMSIANKGCCAECRWAQPSSQGRSHYFACRRPVLISITPWPAAIPIAPHISRKAMRRHDGVNCPCFEAGVYNLEAIP